jgi:hypothetical protein
MPSARVSWLSTGREEFCWLERVSAGEEGRVDRRVHAEKENGERNRLKNATVSSGGISQGQTGQTRSIQRISTPTQSYAKTDGETGRDYWFMPSMSCYAALFGLFGIGFPSPNSKDRGRGIFLGQDAVALSHLPATDPPDVRGR